MKIFCFYEPDPIFSHQESIIEYWKFSWENFGFEPIVLNKTHAKQHPLFNFFEKKISALHYIIKDKTHITTYGMNCYIRWLAYATQSEDFFLVSDYDVINLGMLPRDIEKKFHFMAGHCPCLVSGKNTDFNLISNMFISESGNRLKDIINNDYVKNAPHYHDQEFFVSSFNEDFLKKYDIFLTNELDIEQTHPYLPKNKLVHVSHSYVHKLMIEGFDFTVDINNIYPNDRHRIDIIEFLIKRFIKI